MKLFLLCVSVALHGVALKSWAISKDSFFGEKDFVPGEILVQFRSTTSSTSKDQTLIRRSSLRMHDINDTGLSRVILLNDQNVEQAIQSLKDDPHIESIQPNFIYRMAKTPNDPLYPQGWSLKNTGQIITKPAGAWDNISLPNIGVAGNDIGIESAWDYITDCQEAPIAILDTGINYNHIDLVSNLWNGGTAFPNHGYNFIDGNNDPMDQQGHGTHLAGIIAATGNNSIGISGICWKASLMAVRVLDTQGVGTTASITQGIHFAIQNQAKIINLSVTGSTYDSAIFTAISDADQAGVLVVVPAGNNSTNNDNNLSPNYPCGYLLPNLICVTALDQSFSLASFSNMGPQTVQLAAPGVNLVAPWAGSNAVIDGIAYPSLMTQGWTSTSNSFPGFTSNGWGYHLVQFDSTLAVHSSGPLTSHALTNPNSYDGSTLYSNGTDDRIYKTFDLRAFSPQVAVLDYYAILDTEPGHDFFYTGYNRGVGDPFVSGQQLNSQSGSTQGFLYPFHYNISSCANQLCTIGFRLQTDTSNSSFGVAVLQLAIKTLTYDSITYNVLQGTSLAAAHVSAVASMLMSYNPNFTVEDTLTAMIQGGVFVPSLNGQIKNAKALHAMGALSYIQPPTGLKVIEP